MRMSAQSAKIEAGYVLLPERAPWLQDFQTEILQFPHGRHDDQVPSSSCGSQSRGTTDCG